MPHTLLSSRLMYQGRFVNVRLDRVDLGPAIVEREVVEEMGDGVLVVPLTDDGRIVLIEQSRHLYGTTFEVPAGAINAGEAPADAAARELREEAGLIAGHLELISTHTNSIHMTGRNHYFLATQLQACDADPCDPDEEFLGCSAFTVAEVNALIEANSIPDVRNRGCLWLAQLRLLERQVR